MPSDDGATAAMGLFGDLSTGRDKRRMSLLLLIRRDRDLAAPAVLASYRCRLSCGHSRDIESAHRRPVVSESLFCVRCDSQRSVAAVQRTALLASEPTVVHTLDRDNAETHDLLSPRQFQVLRLLAAGMTQAQVARRLEISPSTVSAHVSRLKRKLGARNKADAVAIASRKRLI